MSVASLATAERLADRVIAGFRDYRRQFSDLTRRAAVRFETRDWGEAQDDARVRILLYDVIVHETIQAIRRQLQDFVGDRATTAAARAAFADWAAGGADSEVAETFFNSVIRRLHGTVGVDPGIEFVADRVDAPARTAGPALDRYPVRDGFQHALGRILDAAPIRATWSERGPRLARAADLVRAELGPDGEWSAATIEMLRPLFFRNKAAYLVGRVRRDDEIVPLILALTHPPGGVMLDAVLPTPDEASVVFGFTRSYLHADVGAPRPTVDFLRTIMPLKRVDELYTALGFNRHGKTEFYRSLLDHLDDPGARFDPAPGQPGLVMAVFTMPSLNVVFKVIRDRFAPPKRTTRQRVIDNYRLIHVGDRVGRLADAQPFERLELPRERFSPTVLDDLLGSAGRAVAVQGETVTIEHLYIERRVRPLDLYLAESDPDAALRATLDFGQAIKDLAAADIFPGDMLVKNFGVTRHGRVIFYDYDEVAPLTSCRFRDPPRAPYPEAEMDDAPHFYVGPHDIFPGEWRPFLGPPGPLRHAFQAAHPELFETEWWRGMQARQRAGEVVDFFPYGEERRLG